MSTSFAVFDILTTSGSSLIVISIPMLAALRSLILILPPNWSPLSSPKTSSGTIHVTSSLVSPFIIASKSIFCFAHVRTKFVSSSIFTVLLVGQDLYKLGCWIIHERGRECFAYFA